MTRNWIACGAPAAFLAGLLMVHCSSSSTTSGGTDAGHPTSGTGTGTGSHQGSSTGVGTGTGTGTAGSSTGTGTGAAGPDYDAGPPSDAAGGDKGAACAPPDGGAACTPGTISCGDASCGVPAQQCCDTDTSEICQTPGATCAGTPITCAEAADCDPGSICCILSTGTTKATGKISCQPGSVCPVPHGAIAAAQVCRSSNECPSGKCQMWYCVGGITIPACENPVPNATTLCSLTPP